MLERLSFSSLELSVSVIMLRVYFQDYVIAHRIVGRVAPTNVFEVMFRVVMMMMMTMMDNHDG